MTKNSQDEDKEAEILSFRSHYREYRVDEIDQVFAEIAEICPEAVGDERSFISAAQGMGTHAPKLTSLRSPVTALTFSQAPGGNRPAKTYYSANVGLAKYAKILARPILIQGESVSRSLIDRYLEGGQYLGEISQSFAGSFGKDVWEAVKQALEARFDKVAGTSIYHENNPVVFIPGPDGGDLQTTPVAPVNTVQVMSSLKNEIWEERDAIKKRNKGRSQEEVEELPPVGSWIRTVISGKVRNVALNVNSSRTRFFAEMPNTLTREDADIWALRKNGRSFPRLRDDDLSKLLVDYAARLNRHRKQDVFVSAEMSHGTDRMADQIIRRARGFISGVLDDVREADPSVEVDEPSIASVLARVWVPDRDRMLVQSALKDTHFTKRVKIGEFA